MRYRLIRPLLPSVESWAAYVEPAYIKRHFSNFGPVNQRFEAAMAARFGGGRLAVSCASATAGLVAAFAALEVRGRVLMPSFTFAATALAVQAARCDPVFCDCDPETLQISDESVAWALQSVDGISAILLVRPFGLYSSTEKLLALAREHGCQIIVDAAAALGAPDASKFGNSLVEVFSLHATKCFPIGEGGLILAPREREAEIRRALNFGFADHETIGLGANGKLSEFHAAIGLSVLDDFEDIIRRRQTVAKRYAEVLSHSAKVDRIWPTTHSPWSFYPVLLRMGANIQAIIQEAADRGVELRRYYRPLHEMKHFKHDLRADDLGNTQDLASRMICLPVYSDMTDQEQDEIVRLLDGVVW
jgi:dTDP-4-amino-4,6-dideoxygalactose transaminase